MTPQRREISRESEHVARRVVELLANRGRLDEPFFTIETLAAKLSVSKRTVSDMLTAAEIPSYRIGGSRRIDPRDVEKYLSARRQEAA